MFLLRYFGKKRFSKGINHSQKLYNSRDFLLFHKYCASYLLSSMQKILKDS